MIFRPRNPIDRLLRGSLRATRPLYRDLIACTIEARPCPSQPLLTLAVARTLILAGLQGQAAAWAAAARQGLRWPRESQPVAPIRFAQAELVLEGADEGLVAGPFLEAVQRFQGKIPTLASTVRRLAERARRAAAVIIAGEVANAIPSLAARIPEVERILRDRFWITGATFGETVDMHRLLAEAVRGGDMTIPDFIDAAQIDSAVALTDARLETIYRNNTQAAWNDGQADVLSNPQVEALIPLAEIDEIKDRRTRGNPQGLYPNAGRHWQMDGYVGTVESLRRRSLIPPCGHNCRGTLRGIPFPEAKARGFIDDDGRVDEEAIREYNGDREAIVASGEYPDPGWAA